MSSALQRRTLCLVALGLIAVGAGPSSASAATTVTVTAPSSARVNPYHVAAQDTKITVSGHTDVDNAYVQLSAEQGGSACNGTNGNPVGADESTTITPAGDYSKQFRFRPETVGNYHLCAYLYNPPAAGGPSPAATAFADVQVHDQLSVGTGGSGGVTGHEATVVGVVQQPSESADWHFEYGTTISYGSVTPTQTKPPTTGPQSGGGSVQADLLSLEPGTTYHYRLVATDGGGTVNGSDQTFTTDPPSSMTLTVPPTRFTDEDWPVTVSGSAGQASGFVLYVEPNGSSCAATDTDEAKRPGAELRSNYFGSGGVGSVPAGQYSGSTSVGSNPEPTPGTYLVCTYLLPNSRSPSSPEASASSLVTVSYRACPSLDFSVTGDSEQTGNKAVFDAVLPAEVGTEGTLVHIASSDGGKIVFAGGDYRPAGDNYITHGGPQQVSTLLNKKKSFLPSFDGPVSVTFTFTYAVVTPYAHCTLPDGTVKDGGQTAEIAGSGFKYSTIRSAPQTITVTFRNHGTPPGGPITPGVATDIENAVGDALTPTGSAAKIGAILKNGYKAPFEAKAAGKVTGAWYFVPKGAHVAGKRKPVLVASGNTTVKKPGKASLKLRVSKKGKALLKKAKKIKLTTKGTFTPSGAGKKLVVKRTIKLRR